MASIRVNLIIEGRVQGVWFRDSTRKKALSLGVFGYVKNRPDGTVKAVAEGPEDYVKEFVSWCHKGPPASHVTAVLESEEEWRGEFRSFEIVF